MYSSTLSGSFVCCCATPPSHHYCARSLSLSCSWNRWTSRELHELGTDPFHRFLLRQRTYCCTDSAGTVRLRCCFIRLDAQIETCGTAGSDLKKLERNQQESGKKNEPGHPVADTSLSGVTIPDADWCTYIRYVQRVSGVLCNFDTPRKKEVIGEKR